MGERADLAERINAPPDPMLLPPSDGPALRHALARVLDEPALRLKLVDDFLRGKGVVT